MPEPEIITFRCPAALAEKLTSVGKAQGKSRSEIIRQALSLMVMPQEYETYRRQFELLEAARGNFTGGEVCTVGTDG